MKKMMITILVILLSVVTSCSKDAEKAEVDQQEQKSETLKEDTEVKEEVSSSEEDKNESKEEIKAVEGMLKYRPEVGVKKTFIVEDALETTSEEYVYETDDYIQKVLKIGQSTTIQVYRWTKDEIALVLEEKDSADPSKNYLLDLDVSNSIDTIYSSKGGWELLKNNEVLKVPYGEFKNVYVFRKSTNEVEGEETLYTQYYAPEVGLIQEEFELTGEQGYKAKSVLQSVEK